jgi:uncharacterized beta-barrel protein YwiB (DUF1934 family)
MKKNVFIRIKGIQQIENEQDVTELYTQGLFYKKNNNYYITYDESETTGYEGSKTTLKIEGNDKVTLMRSGAVKSHLIIQNGTRNVGHYGTNEGQLMVGVYTKQLNTDLTENGGDVHFRYALDINSTLVSENEVFINVKTE